MLGDLLKTGTEVITKVTNNRWEQYLDHISRNSHHEEIVLETAYAAADAFDLYAIFTKMGIAERFHYPLMRLNGYASPSEFTGENKNIKIYDASFMESMHLTYITID